MEPTAAPEATAEERIAPSTSSTSTTPSPRRARASSARSTNPEVYENVPGHVIPILEREFDDFDTEAGKFLDGETAEDQFIGFRLKQGVYGQRQPDVQMIRMKLPMGGVTPEQMDAFADVIEKYAPLNKGHITTRQNIQIHHVPLPDAAKLIREISDVGPLLARGLRQHGPQRHRRPVGRRQRGRALRHHPLRRRLRALLRPPPDDAADAAQDQDGVHGDRRGRRDHRHPRHRLHPARARRRPRGRDPGRRRHLDHAPGRPDALRLRRARQRRLPEGLRGRASGSSTARSGCASTAPAPGSRC